MTDVDRIPCTRCGAMILPITAEQTGGQCMPCHKGLRQMWEWQDQQPRDPAPEWDPKRGDLLRAYTDAIDYDAPVVPPDVLVDIVEIVLGEPPDSDPAEGIDEPLCLGELIEGWDQMGAALGVDWRAALLDELDAMRGQLHILGVELHVTPEGDDGCHALLEANAQTARVSYVPSNDDDFDAVVSAVNRLAGRAAQYRRFRSSLGSDGYDYGLLSADGWSRLEARFPNLTATLFVHAPTPP